MVYECMMVNEREKRKKAAMSGSTRLDIQVGGCKDHKTTTVQMTGEEQILATSPMTASSASFVPAFAPAPAPNCDDLEEDMLKRKLQDIENQVLDVWHKRLNQSEFDAGYISKFIMAREKTILQKKTFVVPMTGELENQLRSLPPLNELMSQVRYWFNLQLEDKSNAGLAMSKLRGELLKTYRQATQVLAQDYSAKIDATLAKYQIGVLAPSTAPSHELLRVLRQEIGTWLQENRSKLPFLDIDTPFACASQPKACLEMLLLLQENLLAPDDNDNDVPVSRQIVSATSLAPAPFAPASPQEYAHMLRVREEARVKAAKERQLKMNQQKDLIRRQRLERNKLWQEWAKVKPLPQWIVQCRKLDTEQVGGDLSTWQVTMLRQRHLTTELRELLTEADAKLRQISLSLVSKTKKRIHDIQIKYEHNERLRTKQIQQVLYQNKFIGEDQVCALKKYMSVAEQLWNIRQCQRIMTRS